jgi:hypothetical protein
MSTIIDTEKMNLLGSEFNIIFAKLIREICRITSVFVDRNKEFYRVETVLEKAWTRTGWHYLIKWQGYEDPSDNSWVNNDNCKYFDAIQSFENK